MPQDIVVLSVTAATLGFVHTIFGPDHYVPFIAMAKARVWTVRKTVFVTTVCGTGHVLSSVLIGLIGIGLGLAVSEMNIIESTRAEIAGWMMIGFGLIYFAVAMKKVFKNKPHSHIHKGEKKRITPWILFTIFVFGPCEVLIPLLMYPASTHSVEGLILVVLVFGMSTILTMLSIVLISLYGIRLAHFGKLERFAHAFAGMAILLCGVAINFVGL